MRLNSLLLSMSLIVLLCSPNFTLAQVVDVSNQVKKIQENENHFGENLTPTPTQETEGEDPFKIKPLANGSETKPVETGQPEPKPVEQEKFTPHTIPEIQDPFGEREPQVQLVEETTTAEPTTETATEPKAMGETFEEKFWTYLKSNAYENWAPAPNSKGDFYVGSSPHGAFLKMYLNRVAVGNPAELPAGSIIVKENYHVDRSTIKAITVMYRSKAYNPANGDWYWVKFNPDGTVDSTSVESGSKPIAGKVTSCIECHSDAEGDDYIFFNDN